MIDQLKKITDPIQRRIMLAIGRCVLTAVYDGKAVQQVQASMLGDEVRDKVDRMQEYGFTSVPLSGAEGVAVFVGGDRGHGIIIATSDSRYRVTGLQGGEVCIYTDEGDKITLKRGNNIEIETNTLTVKAATKVRMETPLLETTGQVKADGHITDNAQTNARTIAGMRTVYNSHTHTGDSGGTTGDPNQDM